MAIYYRIQEDPSNEFLNIANSFASTYPTINCQDFYTLFLRLNADQARGIGEFKLPLSDVGVGFENGNYSNQLNLAYSDLPLWQLFEFSNKIKVATGITSPEAASLVKTKLEYLQGIFDFGLSVNQIDKIISQEMK